MKNKFIVYKLTFPNNKFYVGITKNLKKRIREHIDRANTNKNLPIVNAIKKYKFFKLSILSSHFKLKNAYNSEIYFIKKFNTITPYGYNVTHGGPGVKGFSKLGRIKTKTQIQASINTANTILRKYIEKKRIPIKCSNGKIYESINKASADTGTTVGCIHRVLRGKQLQSKGLVFWALDPKKYKNIHDKYRKRVNKSKLNLIKRMKNLGKPIRRSDGKKYKSYVEAAKELNVTPEAIGAVMKGRSKKCKGYTFTYIKNCDRIKSCNGEDLKGLIIKKGE